MPHFPYVDQVAGAIRAQLEEHGVVASFELEVGSSEPGSESDDFEDHHGSDAEAEHEMNKNRRLERKHVPKKGSRVAALRRSKSRTGTPIHRAESETEPPDGHELEYESDRHDREKNEREQVDCRVLLALDVQINKNHLLDTIEWDLAPSQLSRSPPLPPHLVPSSTLSSLSPYQSSQEVTDDPFLPLPGVSAFPSSPEAFARILCADIGLHGEAVPLVAHALYEEILKHKKDAIEWGVLTAEPLSARARARNPFGPGPRPLIGVWRDWTEVPEFTPRLEVMSQEELERRELERERIARFVFRLQYIMLC